MDIAETFTIKFPQRPLHFSKLFIQLVHQTVMNVIIKTLPHNAMELRVRALRITTFKMAFVSLINQVSIYIERHVTTILLPIRPCVQTPSTCHILHITVIYTLFEIQTGKCNWLTPDSFIKV